MSIVDHLGLLERASSSDLIQRTLELVAVLLGALAFTATIIPAIRALAMDPVRALRWE